MAKQKEEERPEQAEAEQGKYRGSSLATVGGDAMEERMRHSPPDAAAARTVHLGKQIGKQGIAADNLERQRQPGDGGAAAVEQQVKERQQEDAPAAAPEHGCGGVDMLDERGI